MPPEFFLDRSLGHEDVAALLRAAGWTLRTHREVYGDRDETVPDAEWLTRCGRDRWVVLFRSAQLRTLGHGRSGLERETVSDPVTLATGMNQDAYVPVRHRQPGAQ